MYRWALVFCCASLFTFGQTRTGDACVPPPAGVAPTLPAKLLPGQGDIHFAITTSNPQAQAFFDQGVSQMHSFWANEAERSFLQAAALDPEAPMPWWGIAMVAAGDYRPRFQLILGEQMMGKQPRRPTRADAAAAKALELAAVEGKATELEKMYIAAIAARRDAKAADPDQAYIDGLRAIVAKHPDQIEARTYLALHLMRGYTLPDKEPRPGTMEAVEMLRKLMQDAPDHPGVHHYVIHGWEGSAFAKEAWHSCERYSALAPNIPHALHMPGHIYSQTARWSDAARAFEAAAENELSFMRADSLYSPGHHGHNVHYLSTAYSFGGEYEKARAAAKRLLEFRETPPQAAAVDNIYSPYRQGWFGLMRTLVQSESWGEILNGGLPRYEKPRELAWFHWATGLAHTAAGDAEAARYELRRMSAAMHDFSSKTKLPVPPELRVASDELEAHITAAIGGRDEAARMFERASRHERHLVYTEPPLYPRPVAEAYGRWLLRTGKPSEAEAAFRIALEQYPGSAMSEKGLRQAGARESRSVDAGLE